MKHFGMKAAMSVALASALAVPLIARQGQNTPKPTPRETFEATKARERNIQDRGMMLDHIGDNDRQPTKRQQISVLTQTKEDFKRIQVVNNDLMEAVSGSQMIDYKRISNATEEINKCAKRLKVNLAIPDSDRDEQEKPKTENQVDGQQMRASLLKLDNSIMSFVTNPHFQNLGVVDTKNAAKAIRDLNNIVELSNSIRKNAEKLNKAPRNP